MLDETTHDTARPLECCDRCRKAELGRRSGRKPVIRYSQTAASGKVQVFHGGKHIATLRKDSLFGWGLAETPVDAVRYAVQADGFTRREALDRVAEAYTLAWRAGNGVQ